MKKEEIINKLEEAGNFQDVFSYYIDRGCFKSLSFFADGSFGCLTQGEIENPANDPVGFLDLPEPMDDYIYAEGWAEENENGTWTAEDNRILTTEEMKKEAIEEGDWSHIIEEIEGKIEA